MARFAYKAYDAAGVFANGEISAASREGAVDALRRKGQIPVEVREHSATQETAWWNRDIFNSGLSSAALATFTRELASLVKADIPVDEALRIIALQPMLPLRVRVLTQGSLERLLEGEPLSNAFAAQEGLPEYYTRLIKAGEAAGSLAEVLTDLAGVLEHQAEASRRVRSALMYPAVLVFAAAAAVAVIVTVLVPAILPIFEDAGAEPPVLLLVLGTLSRQLSEHGLQLVLLLIATVAGLAALANHPTHRLAIDRVLIRLPLAGLLIEQRETGWLARTLSLMTRNGVPLLDALRIAAGVLANRAYSSAVLKSADAVKEGSTLTAALGASGLFPDLFLRLTAIGEKTGQLEAMHQRVAAIYEDALRRHVERLTNMLTPVLTLLIGGCVGGLIVSVMSAIFSVNDLALK